MTDQTVAPASKASASRRPAIIRTVTVAPHGLWCLFFILAPLAFGLAFELGFNPILAIIAVQGGASLGGYMPWTMLGSLQIGMFEGIFGSHQ